MRRRLAVVSTLFATLATAMLATVVPAVAQPGPTISFCHRTGSTGSPYNFHQGSAGSILDGGHHQHTGPVFSGQHPTGAWGDIVPPFDYRGVHFAGLNWNSAGRTIVANRCAVRFEPPPPRPTTTTNPSAPTTAPTRVTTGGGESPSTSPVVTTPRRAPTASSTARFRTSPPRVTTTTPSVSSTTVP